MVLTVKMVVELNRLKRSENGNNMIHTITRKDFLGPESGNTFKVAMILLLHREL